MSIPITVERTNDQPVYQVQAQISPISVFSSELTELVEVSGTSIRGLINWGLLVSSGRPVPSGSGPRRLDPQFHGTRTVHAARRALWHCGSALLDFASSRAAAAPVNGETSCGKTQCVAADPRSPFEPGDRDVSKRYPRFMPARVALSRLLLLFAVLSIGCSDPQVSDSTTTTNSENGGDGDGDGDGSACQGDASYLESCFVRHELDIPAIELGVGDLDDDGNLELVALDYPEERIYVAGLRGGSLQLIATGEVSLSELSGIAELALVDFNGDGRRDIAAFKSGGVSIHEYSDEALTQTNSLTTASGAAAFPRVVGPFMTGAESVVATSSASPFQSQLATFDYGGSELVESPPLGTAGCWASGPAVNADFDGNGVDDVVYVFATGDCDAYPEAGANLLVARFESSGSATVSELASSHHGALRTGELDGQPGAELIAISGRSALVFNGGPDGPGASASPSEFSPGTRLGPFADLDGDGIDEFVIGIDGEGVAIVANIQSPGEHQAFISGLESSVPSSLSADLNADAVDDLIFIELDQDNEPRLVVYLSAAK